MSVGTRAVKCVVEERRAARENEFRCLKNSNQIKNMQISEARAHHNNARSNYDRHIAAFRTGEATAPKHLAEAVARRRGRFACGTVGAAAVALVDAVGFLIVTLLAWNAGGDVGDVRVGAAKRRVCRRQSVECRHLIIFVNHLVLFVLFAIIVQRDAGRWLRVRLQHWRRVAKRSDADFAAEINEHMRLDERRKRLFLSADARKYDALIGVFGDLHGAL